VTSFTILPPKGVTEVAAKSTVSELINMNTTAGGVEGHEGKFPFILSSSTVRGIGDLFHDPDA
jgi:hypothetical protein